MPSGDSEPKIFEQAAMFFDNITDNSGLVSRALMIKDFANKPNLVLKQPICLECFDEILNKFQAKVKAEEMERDMYKQELIDIEKEMETLHSGSVLYRDLERLLQEEADLDAQIERMENTKKS